MRSWYRRLSFLVLLCFLSFLFIPRLTGSEHGISGSELSLKLFNPFCALRFPFVPFVFEEKSNHKGRKGKREGH